MNTHYIKGIARLLELPNDQFVNKTNFVTRVRAQIENTTILLTFWGSSLYDLPIFYKTPKYLIVEGLLSTYDQSTFTSYPFKEMEIIVLKAYPAFYQI